MRMSKYLRASNSTRGLPSIAANAISRIGHCTAINVTPAASATNNARPRLAQTSSTSPAPQVCAVSPVVAIRRNPNAQKTKEKIRAPTAMAPI